MDEPIVTIIDDEFSLKGEVQEFTKYLLGRNTSTNLIVSIQAPWGEGKSSFLNLVKGELDSKKGEIVQVIPFNPWQFSGHQDLLQQFFAAFAESKGISDEFKGALASIGSLANLTALAPGLELVGLIGKVLGKGADLANSIPKENIQELREQAKLAAKEQNQHYIFLVDELDRLESHEIRAFLQMIKAVADFPNTTYVLAYDVEALEDLLRESKIRNPSAYLEKIIGYPYSLPSINTEDLQRHHLTEINDILGKQNLETIDYERWSTNEVYAALPNLRQCKRHAAHFEFLCRSVGNYVDTTDLAYVSIIQLLDPMLWRTIGENQNWFWGTSNGGSEPNQGLIDLKKKCLSQGKESVWQIVCIVYEGVVERSKLDGDDLFLPPGLGVNQPIRAASNNSFFVYHTRKPASAWSKVETSLLKQAFKEKVEHRKLYSLFIDHPEESMIWAGHLVDNIGAYKELDVACFTPQFIMIFESNVGKKGSDNFLGESDCYNFIKRLGTHIELVQGILSNDIGLTEEYKQSPLYYALKVEVLPREITSDDRDGFSNTVNERLQQSHKEFWGQLDTLTEHPFIHWAFSCYISKMNAKGTHVSSMLMKEVGGEPLWLKKGVFPLVLLFVDVARSQPRLRSKDNYKLCWKLVLGVIPDFSEVYQRVDNLKDQPEIISKSASMHKTMILDIFIENDK